MNLNDDSLNFQEQSQSLDETKELNLNNSKILDFNNIDKYDASNNFASYYALNRLSNHLENRASIKQNYSSVMLMQKYKKQNIIRTCCFYIYLIITIFQRPNWCNFVDYQEYCTAYNGKTIPKIIDFYIPINIYYCIEIVLVVYLCLNKVVKARILGSQNHKRIAKVQVIITLLIIINDITVMILENNSPINISLLMKPIFIIVQKSILRSTIFHYCQIVNNGKEIYYLMIFSLIFFAGLGSAIFSKKDNPQIQSNICLIDQPPFSQKEKCIIIILFILQTTDNSPDIYLSYYGKSRIYISYFIIFQFVNTLLIINLVLAFFYSSYKDLMQEKTKQILSKYNHRFSLQTQKFFRNRTNSDITRIVDISLLENVISRQVYQILDDKYYEIFIEILSLISFVMIFLQITHFKLYILLFCNSIIFAECILLLFYAGKKKIWRKKYLIFEFLFSISILLLIILNLIGYKQYKILLILLCYRLFRGCKWMLKNKSFTVLIISITTIFQYIVQLFGTLFILFMIFTAIGQLLFGGKILFSDEKEVHYDLANFNDFLSGMCTCWFLLINNNWNVLSYNYAKRFNTDLVYIFFISYYIIIVLLTLNVTITLLIEYIVSKISPKNKRNVSQSEPKDEIIYDEQK